MTKFFAISFLLICTSVFAEIKTFIRDYTYQAGEADSKITSRTISLDQVKRLLLEELGVYLESRTEVVNNQLTKDEIRSVTAGITQTKILEEKWNGESYYIKAQITVDSEEMNRQLNEIAKDRKKVDELDAARRRADAAQAELDELKRKMAESKSDDEKVEIQKEYQSNVDVISSSNLLMAGFQQTFTALGNTLDGYVKEFTNGMLGMNFNTSAMFSGMNSGSARENTNTSATVASPGVIHKEKSDLSLFDQGVGFFNQGNYLKSSDLFKQQLDLTPNHAESCYYLGLIYGINQDRENELYFLRKAAGLGSVPAAAILKNRGR